MIAPATALGRCVLLAQWRAWQDRLAVLYEEIPHTLVRSGRLWRGLEGVRG